MKNFKFLSDAVRHILYNVLFLFVFLMSVIVFRLLGRLRRIPIYRTFYRLYYKFHKLMLKVLKKIKP